MKILHTSDWHLGHALYNYDRSEEQICFLNQLTGIVQEEQPDVMVVSGDIYHYSTPSAATQKMYTDGLLRIHQACPSMTIVVTAGNHDSSSKLEIDSNLWDHFRVKVIGHIERCGSAVNWEKQIITIPGQDGNPVGYIAAMPHVYPQNFPILSDDTPREERQSRFFQALLDETGKQNTQQLPVVLMAHLSVEGSDRTGQDDSAGGMEFISLSTLGKGYDYLALGHIHCPQTLKGSENHARYCGTPLPVSFDETYPHSVTIVQIRHQGEQPKITIRSIRNPWPLLTLPDTPVPFDEALKALEAYPDHEQTYIRLNVLIRDYLVPDCNEKASAATRGKACRFCYIKCTREQQEQATPETALTIQEVKEMSPLDIAKRYYREAEGEEMDEELCTLMQEVITQVHAKDI